MARNSVGRKKLVMRKMTVKSNLDVTFSKRRSGLFKKACELCTLCMCEIVIIIFSPQQKPYSLGHRTVESVLNKFLNRNPPQENSRRDQLVASLQDDNILSLNTELANLNNAIEVEKKRVESLGEKMKAQRKDYWWLRPIDELNVEEVQQMLLAVDEMQKNVGIGQLERSISSIPGAVSLLQYNNTAFFDARSSGSSIDLARASGPTIDPVKASGTTVGVSSIDLSRAIDGVNFAPPPPPPHFNNGFAAFADPTRASIGVSFAPSSPPPPPPPHFNSGFAPFADPTRASGGFSGGGFRFPTPSDPRFEFMNHGSSSGVGSGDVATPPNDGGASGSGSRGYIRDRNKGKAPMMD